MNSRDLAPHIIAFDAELCLPDTHHDHIKHAMLFAADEVLDSPSATRSSTLAAVPIEPLLLPLRVRDSLGSDWRKMNVTVTHPPVDTFPNDEPLCSVQLTGNTFGDVVSIDPIGEGQDYSVTVTNDSYAIPGKSQPNKLPGLPAADVFAIVRSSLGFARWEKTREDLDDYASAMVDTVLDLRSQRLRRSETVTDVIEEEVLSGDNTVHVTLSRTEKARVRKPKLRTLALEIETAMPICLNENVDTRVESTLAYSFDHLRNAGGDGTMAHLKMIFSGYILYPRYVSLENVREEYGRVFRQTRLGHQEASEARAVRNIRGALDILTASYRAGEAAS